MILVRIARQFRQDMSNLELYEATRGVWRVGPRRELAQFALAVVNGQVVEVFDIVGWYPAGSTAYFTRTLESVEVEGRWEFVGRVAGGESRARYVGHSVKDRLPAGAQNPITYVNC